MGKRNRRYRKRRSGGLGLFITLVIIGVVVAVLVTILGLTSSKSSFRESGINSLNEGDYDKSIEWFKSALAQEQWMSEDIDLDIRYYLAEAYIHTGEYDKALKQYNILIKANSNYEDTLFYQEITLALENYQKGNYDEAIVSIENAISRGYDELYVFEGSCYGMKGDYEQMFASFETYLESYEESTYVYSQYASAYINLAQFDNAKTYIDKGLALEEDTYRQNLLFDEIAYYEYMQDYDTAFAKAKEFVELYPDNEEGKEEYDFLYTRVAH